MVGNRHEKDQTQERPLLPRQGDLAMVGPGEEENSSKGGQDDLVKKARELQRDIDDLKDAIRQAHRQQLDPKHIEPMNEMLARLLKELMDLFQ